MSDGIDMRKSGWTNPDGFTPEPRPATPAPPPDEVCGNQGPDGWVCDLKPGHTPVEQHWADTGEPGGLRWTRSLIEVSAWGDVDLPPEKRPTIQGAISEVPRGPLGEIREIAEEALDSERAADWAAALKDIIKVVNRA